MEFDDEEKMILDAIENDELELRTPLSKDLDYYQEVATNTFKKDKRITIRLYDHDYVGIQKKAMELGIVITSYSIHYTKLYELYHYFHYLNYHWHYH